MRAGEWFRLTTTATIAYEKDERQAMLESVPVYRLIPDAPAVDISGIKAACEEMMFNGSVIGRPHLENIRFDLTLMEQTILKHISAAPALDVSALTEKLEAMENDGRDVPYGEFAIDLQDNSSAEQLTEMLSEVWMVLRKHKMLANECLALIRGEK